MSLMLNALKRIEAKRASLRDAVAPAAVETIKIPPELVADGLSQTDSDIALPGPVSIDMALNDLSDLIAEARLLEQPALDDAAPPVVAIESPACFSPAEENQAVITDSVVSPADDACGTEVCEDVIAAPPVAADESSPGLEHEPDNAAAIEFDAETPVGAEVSFVIAEDLLDMLHDSSPADWLSIEEEADDAEANGVDWIAEEPVHESEASSAELLPSIEDSPEAAEEISPQAAAEFAPPAIRHEDWAQVEFESPLPAMELPQATDVLHESIDSLFAALAASSEVRDMFPAAPPEADFALDVTSDSPMYAAPVDEADSATAEAFEASEEPCEQAADDAVENEPVTAFVEPPVIQPIGSDPYAATAWQILSQLPQGRSQVLMFTSPADGHGKTTTLAGLLPHLARNITGNVLVVDANTHNPEMARRLKVAATWRLTDVLAGATDWMNAVRPTALPRVSVLPGGSDGSRRSSSVQPIVRLLRELTSHYELVVVDASSLAHDGAAQLAAACDATYLVVRLGEGNRRIVRDAVRVIDQAGGRLLGCVAVDAGV